MHFYLYVLNVTLLMRLLTFRGDSRSPVLSVLAIGIAQFAAVWFVVAHAGTSLLLLLLFYIALTLAVEFLPGFRVQMRLVVLVLFAAGLGYVAVQNQLGWQPWVNELKDWLGRQFVFGNVLVRTGSQHAQLRIAGLLLCLDEANMLVRIALTSVGIAIPDSVQPTSQPPATASPQAGEHTATKGEDEQHQLLRSAVVGNIERIFVFIFVLHGAFNAVAFIITAKGIVRFHELVKKEWIAYVLIGTLMSTLTAMALGLLALQLSAP